MAYQVALMTCDPSLETYWLTVPLIGIALTIPYWIWALIRYRRDKHRAVK